LVLVSAGRREPLTGVKVKEQHPKDRGYESSWQKHGAHGRERLHRIAFSARSVRKAALLCRDGKAKSGLAL